MFGPAIAWCTESRSVAPQPTQRLPSRIRAARLSFCHAAVLISGLEEPERCGLAQRAQRPRVLAATRTPQPGQTRASKSR